MYVGLIEVKQHLQMWFVCQFRMKPHKQKTIIHFIKRDTLSAFFLLCEKIVSIEVKEMAKYNVIFKRF